ncbi:ABC transporter permease subunit [Rhodobacter sphaeroides]|jgi:oligopeptide transport system permease protein|uniref:ABC oligopeptide transporter, inner membrane subunit OppB n=1 Tax=Cereibacter sphaeroides (strain ATCC 17023 / DSM 158 / JCM 6121 / CCUG 31486 / LMG 2827 / NBRC 12203 / NCIMB 8253 / ATH 2.4.1.) TaxID=272943 RepID=Q3J6G2_CERS4|nr:ABC transporter permease subunit [Cereibacter sphaeroides]ABA77622.1 ABC oligopeptide transporter, inner membrane subunit OppB [Cereibacter sphaeroides 2.4.1]AMJ46027.1 ABC transporter [Cereibacter sphaeroides]ANS32738.1 ABC transporter [Cereibacter sphaeroides]ATN61791.1 ABC transporter [Cereibacter sphaeroides]AXC59873.1 ABC transporter permease subunit [Cereibacter sphaeroides 2.4.1]
MLRYTLRRLASAVPTVFIIVTLTFFMIRLAPGGPFDLERPLDPLIMENLKRAYNLDGSLWSQYLTYMGNLMQGDLGPSFTKRDFTVNDLFASGLPISMLLGGLAISLAVAIGTILGAIAALRQNSWLDYTIVGLATFGITTPNFVVAPLLSLFFGVILRWLPAGGWSSSDPTYWVLPVVTLALPQVAVIARLVRGATIEALRSNHVRTARAYGLPARTVVVKHALRAAMLPAVSYLGPTAAGLLTGSVVVETIFGLPGIGRYFVQGALGRDYTLVMGTVVVIALFILLFNLIVDLLYTLLDPRVRYD